MISPFETQASETRSAMRGGPGNVQLRHYFQRSDFVAKVRLCCELTVPPGAGVGSHAHEGEDEIFIIQQGRGIINENGKECEVAVGDAILTGKGAVHSVLNNGEEDLVITTIIIQY